MKLPDKEIKLISSSKIVLDNFECPNCTHGTLKKTGEVFMTRTEQHVFKCDLCKYIVKIKFN